MKAMILAAGLGARLKPLTDTCPKALVEVAGRPMLAWVVARLAQHGFFDIIINAHYLADQIWTFVENYNARHGHTGVSLTVSYEQTLLDTGGGVQYAADFFDDGQPFLVHNVDVLTDLDLNALMTAHRNSDALATLAVKPRKTSRYLLFDDRERLCGWQSLQTGETRMTGQGEGPFTPLSFMCVQALSPHIFTQMTQAAPFSIIDAYLNLATAGNTIRGFRGDDARWIDLGRREHLDRAPGLFGPAYFEALKENT